MAMLGLHPAYEAGAGGKQVGDEATPNPNIAICMATLGFACACRQRAAL